MVKSTYDIIIIGGGASGMFAAATAVAQGKKVLLLEKNDRLGKKLAITGKGRCNLTNNCSAEEVLKNTPRNARFLYSAMYGFPPERTMEFFEAHGCPLKTERGNRVFPSSDKSMSVITALKDAMRGVTVRQARVDKIYAENGKVSAVRADGAVISAPCMILATGGKSYPLTGSTGDGYALAEQLGHTVISPTGSLVPMVEQECRA